MSASSQWSGFNSSEGELPWTNRTPPVVHTIIHQMIVLLNVSIHFIIEKIIPGLAATHASQDHQSDNASEQLL